MQFFFSSLKKKNMQQNTNDYELKPNRKVEKKTALDENEIKDREIIV